MILNFFTFILLIITASVSFGNPGLDIEKLSKGLKVENKIAAVEVKPSAPTEIPKSCLKNLKKTTVFCGELTENGKWARLGDQCNTTLSTESSDLIYKKIEEGKCYCFEGKSGFVDIKPGNNRQYIFIAELTRATTCETKGQKSKEIFKANSPL